MRGAGFLAIWSDVERSNLTDYRHWLTREHTTERVTTDGFLANRVFRAIRADIERFFILYELEKPEVLDGPAYLARLNSPSPWSQRIMPQLGNFMRGGGAVIARAPGGARGPPSSRCVSNVCRKALNAWPMILQHSTASPRFRSAPPISPGPWCRRSEKKECGRTKACLPGFC